MPRYETYAKIKLLYNISPQTVRNWATRGSIGYKCVQNETRKTWLYDVDSIGVFIQKNTDDVAKEIEAKRDKPVRIIYTRVSSTKQAADLQRQRDLLSAAFPDTEVVEDIGSGLNFHRHGFTKLVRRICNDEITQVVVSFKDRLCRFGYELFELICSIHGTTILVYGDGIVDPTIVRDDESKLKDDLLSVVNVFVASHNGKRAQVLRKERRRLAEQNIDSDGDFEGEALPHEGPAEAAPANV